MNAWRIIIISIMVISLVGAVSGAFNIFSPSPPPGLAPASVCLLSGCNMSGPIYMNGQFLYNVTIVNGTYLGMINHTQVSDPIWLPLAGGTITDNLLIDKDPAGDATLNILSLGRTAGGF